MKMKNVCMIPVLLTDLKKRPWEIVDKDTGAVRKGVANTLRGVMIPENADIDPTYLKEVEFNIYDNNPAIMGIAEVSKTFYRNEERFAKGECYAMIEASMAPKVNKDGLVTIFSPYVNTIQVITPSDEERPRVVAATHRNKQL